MATAKQIPYGTLANVSDELRHAYYYFHREEKLPPLPEVPIESDRYEQDFSSKHDGLVFWDAVNGMLSTRERQVIYMRYWQDMSLEGVAMHMRLTRERIRQIEAKAFRRIKMHIVYANQHMYELRKIPHPYKKLYPTNRNLDLRFAEFCYYFED